MSTKTVLCVGVVGLAVLAVASACSSDFDGASDGSSGATSTSSSSGEASSSGTASSSSGAASSSGDGACTPTVAPAESVPFDLYVLVDGSGSMVEAIPGAEAGASTKWDVLKSTLKGFIADSKNAGVGVGLGFLPIVHAGAPASCTNDNECAPDFGFCIKKACDVDGYNGALLPCESAGDCPNNAACNTLLSCNLTICIQNGASQRGCAQSGCPSGGTPVTSSICAKKECVLGDYEAPRVAIAALPGNAATLTTSIDAIPTPTSASLTPTSAALAGSLAYALQYAAANTDRAAAVLFVTDGSANRCPPYTGAGMASFVSAAHEASSSVRTFVVGLIAASETTSKTNFDAIASAGGTRAATIIAPSATLGTDLGNALAEARSEAACTVKVPGADYAKVTLRLADGAGTVVAKKANAAACDANGGWYFDVDPAAGTPKKMFLCPTTCATVKGGTKVDTAVGCP